MWLVVGVSLSGHLNLCPPYLIIDCKTISGEGRNA